MQASPKLGLDLSSGTVAHHTPSVCMLCWRPKPECQMPIWGHWSGVWISLNLGGCIPLLRTRGALQELPRLGICAKIWLIYFLRWPKLGPEPSKAHFWHFQSREKPYKCTAWTTWGIFGAFWKGICQSRATTIANLLMGGCGWSHECVEDGHKGTCVKYGELKTQHN